MVRSPLQLLAMLGALTLASLTPGHAQNLITNGDFEAGNAGWTISAGSFYTRATYANRNFGPQAYQGNYFANFGEVGAPGSMSQTITTVSGYHYRFTFYLYRQQESFNANSGDFFTAAIGGNTLLSVSGMAYGLPYNRYSYVIQAAGTSTLVEFTGQDNQDEYALDSVSLTRLTADATNTLTALSWDRSNLRNLLTHRSGQLASMLDYDCTRIRHSLCITLQARITGSSAMSDGGGVLIAAWQPRAGFRFGAFFDQQTRASMPDRMQENGSRPAFGFFVTLGRDHAPGLRARASWAWRSGGLSLTRDASLAYTDAGQGRADLRERGGSLELTYGFGTGSLLLSPLLGLTMIRAERGAYREAEDIFAPISYSAFSRVSRSLRLGLQGEGELGDKLRWRASLAAERDFSGRVGAFAGTSDIPGLESFSFASEPLQRSWRPLARAGFDYGLWGQIGLTARLSHRGGAQGATSLMAGLRLDL